MSRTLHRYAPTTSMRSRDTRFRCVVKGCRKLVGILPNGYEHPCCPEHGAELPRAVREAIALVADRSIFDAGAQLEAAQALSKVRLHFARKASRNA